MDKPPLPKPGEFAHGAAIFKPQNRCPDFAYKCRAGASHITCWMRNPARGWCPYLVTDAARAEAQDRA